MHSNFYENRKRKQNFFIFICNTFEITDAIQSIWISISYYVCGILYKINSKLNGKQVNVSERTKIEIKTI